MSVMLVIIAAISKPVAKWAFSRVISGLAGDAASDIIAALVKRGVDKQEAKATAASVVQLVNEIVRSVGQSLSEQPHDNLNPEAVANELAHALDDSITTSALIENDLDQDRILESLRQLHPLAKGMFSAKEHALYDRGLRALSQALVQAAPKLPNYTQAMDNEVLRRLRNVRTDLGTVAHGTAGLAITLTELHHHAIAQPKVERTDFADDYRTQVADNLDELDLFGVDILKDSRKYKLSVAYISVNLESATGEAQSGPQQVDLVFKSLKGKRLLIRGDAGSGKTTLLKWAAIRCASAGSWGVKDWKTVLHSVKAKLPVSAMDREMVLSHFRQATSSDVWQPQTTAQSMTNSMDDYIAWADEYTARPWSARIPFFIRLRDCTGGKLPPIGEFAKRTAALHKSVPQRWEEEVLKAGDGLVLLDGIDEVPPKFREGLHKQIRRLITEFPDCLYVLTTRPLTKGEPEWLDELHFQQARVAPMSAVDRERCIDKWHEAIADESSRLGRTDSRLAEHCEQLKLALRDAPEVARLATNPLLCAMICALHRSKNHLPDSLNELLESLTMMLLYSRERETPDFCFSDFDVAYSGLSYAQRRAIVSHLAKYMVQEGHSALTAQMARKKVGEALTSIKDRTASESDSVLKGLIERSGMLREKTVDTIDFIHNTFKEYLAATRYLDEDAVKPLEEHADDPNWENVLVFAGACAITKPQFSESLIAGLLPPDPGAKVSAKRKRTRARTKESISAAEARQYRRSVMAMRIYAAIGTSLSERNQRRLKQLQKTLFPPRTLSDAAGLATAGNAVLKFVSYSTTLTPSQRVRCIRTLRLIGTEEAKARLLDYRNDRTVEVIEELAQAIDPLLIPAVVDAISETAATLVDRASRTGDEWRWRHLIADAARGQIQSCRALTGRSEIIELNLSGTRVTDETMAELANPKLGMNKLEALHLANTKVSDAGLFALSAAGTGMTALKTLNLLGTDVTDIGIIALSSRESDLRNVVSLHLGRTKVGDAAAAALAQPDTPLKNLQTLFLDHTSITDAGVTALCTGASNLRELRELDLSGTTVSDKGLVALASPTTRLRALMALDLSGTSISDAGFTALSSETSGLTRLTTLTLVCPGITDVGIENLSRPNSALSSLLSLSLNSTKLTHVGVRALAAPKTGLPGLLRLDTSNTFVNDRALELLSRADSGLKRLSALMIGSTVITDAGLMELARANTGVTWLSDLYLHRTQVTDKGLDALLDSASGLKNLKMIYALDTPITSKRVAAWEQARRDVQILI
jgi:energy-coupling factor transporter ATP-binding protein EcfA2